MNTYSWPCLRCNIYSFQNHLFSFFVLNSPEKPVSVQINFEDEPTKKYMDAETSL